MAGNHDGQNDSRGMGASLNHVAAPEGNLGGRTFSGPGVAYLRSCGLRDYSISALAARTNHRRFHAELEKCGLYWRRREPHGLHDYMLAITNWMTRARIHLREEDKTTAAERAKAEALALVREARALEHADRSRAEKIHREREQRRKNHEAQAEARWQEYVAATTRDAQ